MTAVTVTTSARPSLFSGAALPRLIAGVAILAVWELVVSAFAPDFVARPSGIARAIPPVIASAPFLRAIGLTLWSVADALGVSIAELFNGAEPEPLEREPTARGPVQPQETRRVITLADGIRWERLTPLSDDELDFVLVVYPPGAASCPADALTRHGGREFGYVVSGTLAVEVGFDEHVLRMNDSIAFDSSMPHRLRAVGDEPAVAVWAVLHRHGDDRDRNFEAASDNSAGASIT